MASGGAGFTGQSLPGTGFVNMRQHILEVLDVCVGQNARCVSDLSNLLAKAFPSKSNIRNFGEVASSYMLAKNDGEFVFIALRYIVQTMLCSGTTLQDAIKSSVAQALQTCTVEQFCVWVSERQEAVFLALKWYIVQCMSVSECSVLSEVACEHYSSYSAFVEAVNKNVAMLHDEMQKNFDRGNSLLDACTGDKVWCRNVRITVRSRSSTRLKRARAIVNVVKQFVKQGGSAERDNDKMWNLYRFLLHRSNHNDDNLPVRLLEACEVEVDSVRVLWAQHKFDRAAAVKALRRMSQEQITTAFELSKAIELKHNVCVHRLPRNVRNAQMQARRRRFGTDLVCTSTHIFGCPNCKELKAFVVEDSSKCNNAFANGCSRVLVDAADGEPDVMYCGRKQEKGQAGRRGVLAMCCDTRLARLPAYGSVITWFGKSYSLCTGCTRLQPHTHEQCCICRSGGDEPVQGDDIGPRSTACFHCGSMNAKHSYGEADTSLPVCGSCRRPWMLAQLAQGQKWPPESLELHRAIDHNWGTARWAEHFDVIVD